MEIKEIIKNKLIKDIEENKDILYKGDFWSYIALMEIGSRETIVKNPIIFKEELDNIVDMIIDDINNPKIEEVIVNMIGFDLKSFR